MINFRGLLSHFLGPESMDFPVNEVAALRNFSAASLGHRPLMRRSCPGVSRWILQSRCSFCLANQGLW
jgi:hypothetical protein